MHASFLDRVVAFLYDYVLISIYLVVLAVVTVIVMRVTDAGDWADFFSSPIRADLVAFSVTVLPVSLYFAVSESSSGQASWGKRRRRIKVETVHGERLGRPTALARAFLKFLPWQLAHTCLFNIPGWPTAPETPPHWVIVGFGMVWVLVSCFLLTAVAGKENQALYDRLLGIRVVRVPD